MLVLLLLGAVGMIRPANAIEVTSLYTVEVPLDQSGPNAQEAAYRAALAEVLVRITGTLAAAQSEELMSLFPNPGRYVTQYRSGTGDTLVVTLDGPAIEALLRQSGAAVWGSDRPLTVIWLAVDWGLGDREIVAADDPERLPGDARSIDRNRLLRERVQSAASRRGVPIVFPLLDAEDLANISFVDIWGGFDEPLLAASARYGASSVLVGRLRPDDLQPPRWTWYFGEQRFGWPGQPEEAIDQLADALAARQVIRGDADVETIELTISGIDSVRAYGQVDRYLANLRVIDRLIVKSASFDRIVYDVDVRGGSARLTDALSLTSFLEPVEAGSAIDTRLFPAYGAPQHQARSLEYHYRPATSARPPQPLRDDEPES